MQIYNTFSGKKENLDEVIANKEIHFFVCGPTVYDHSHIGHARTYIAFDIVANYLRSLGYKLFYLQNITDVDDKIIQRAKEQKKSFKEIAAFFTKEYLRDMKALGIKSVSKYARASRYIPQITKQIQVLIKKGHAYKIDGDGYYFDLSTFPEYGKLAKRTISQAEDAISRIDENARKKNKGDFALWKFYKEGAADGEPRQRREPYWNTPLGKGRPGWHIEDTAISEYYFGPQYEIHGGALDLKFPHHEAEIAQQESASGKKPFVKIWMHTGFLLINGQKMSKSLGNFVTIKDFLKKYSTEIFRYLIASHHYRSPLDYNESLAEQSKSALKTITEFLAKMALAQKKRLRDSKSEFKIDDYDKKFTEAMGDDFNTPQALAVVFNLINEVNPKIWELNKKNVEIIKKWVENKMRAFGISLKTPKIPLKIRLLSRKRELLRGNKQFIKADDLRKKIESLGYTVEDMPSGSLILKE